jgi:catechol 2,3-dioxygenase-like lactoylglutathione lyase family enzyme
MPNAKLPERASLDYLRKLAKNHLPELRRTNPDARLADALLKVARDHGFSSWRALKAQLDDRSAKRVESPVMRFLPVSNIDRAVAFYRDILGFEIRQQDSAVEAVMGPALIRFGSTGFAPTDWETPRPPGSAVVFLQSHDVEALHTAIRSRGGRPSSIEKVNWIKMRMFEVRDPDGNVLWFGQTYHVHQDSPSRRDGQPQGLRHALPELPCDDVAVAVDFYRDVLGFRINYQQQDLGVMDRDAITLLLIARTDQHKGIGSCGFYVADADLLYEEFLAKGARVLGPPVSRPWGLRDFRVLDPEGNRLTFSQTFE